MFGRRKDQDRRLLALESVLQETRLTLDGMFTGLAGVLARFPDIAEDLRVAAACTKEAPVTDEDAAYRARVIQSREEIANLLNFMATIVDLNREKAGRVVFNRSTGVQ